MHLDHGSQLVLIVELIWTCRRESHDKLFMSSARKYRGSDYLRGGPEGGVLKLGLEKCLIDLLTAFYWVRIFYKDGRIFVGNGNKFLGVKLGFS